MWKARCSVTTTWTQSASVSLVLQLLVWWRHVTECIAISGHTPVQSGHSVHLRQKKNLIKNLRVAAWRQVKSWTSNQMKHLEGSEFWSDYREGRTLKTCYSHKKSNTLAIKAEQRTLLTTLGEILHYSGSLLANLLGVAAGLFCCVYYCSIVTAICSFIFHHPW